MGHRYPTRWCPGPSFNHQRRHLDLCFFLRQCIPLHRFSLSVRFGADPSSTPFPPQVHKNWCSSVLCRCHLLHFPLDLLVMLEWFQHSFRVVPEFDHHLHSLHVGFDLGCLPWIP